VSLPAPPPDAVPHGARKPISWLDRTLSARWCALGWMMSVTTFLGLMRLLGGPATGDSPETIYATWAIAHGKFACAYPPPTTLHFYPLFRPQPPAPPLWPLLSGGFAALLRIGHRIPFPSGGALGPHCATAFDAIYRWAGETRATLPTVGLGYLSWLVLMAGVIALLRSSGRGRCGWEPATLVLLACLPPLWMPLLNLFHPQDLMAVGLALGGLACARRGWWAWAGGLLGLAFTSQQFAVLVAAPLLVMAPWNRRLRFAGSAIAAAALVTVPMIAVTSGRALRATVLGSGNTLSFGGTVLWELHLHGTPLVAVSRLLPIALSVALAWWAVRRLGATVREPVPLVSVIAISLSLRLVFEQNLFGYYFMALVVSLVVLDVIGGQIRGPLVAWLVLVFLAFILVPIGLAPNAEPWGLQADGALRLAAVAAAVLFIVLSVARARFRPSLLAWSVLVVVAFSRWPPWMDLPLRHQLPLWFWQVVLVATGAALAAGPLVSSVRVHGRVKPSLTDVDEDVALSV